VFLAGDREKPELRNAAQHVSRDVWASGGITDVFSQFFFAAVWSDQTGSDHDTGHRYENCSPCEPGPQSSFPLRSHRFVPTDGLLSRHRNANCILRLHEVIQSFCPLCDGEFHAFDLPVELVTP
jgi:hypothetical protein